MSTGSERLLADETDIDADHARHTRAPRIARCLGATESAEAAV
ncbi:hypothetical protein ACWD1Y_15135 [Streptomyces sp. NPDC002814]